MLHISETGLKTRAISAEMNFENRFKSLTWTSNINQELPIKLTAHEGPGSEVPTTLSRLFLEKAHLLKD